MNQELIQRALARFMRGQGGQATQNRLSQAGLDFTKVPHLVALTQLKGSPVTPATPVGTAPAVIAQGTSVDHSAQTSVAPAGVARADASPGDLGARRALLYANQLQKASTGGQLTAAGLSRLQKGGGRGAPGFASQGAVAQFQGMGADFPALLAALRARRGQVNSGAGIYGAR